MNQNLTPKFKVGDIVRLRTGKSPQRVMQIRLYPERGYVALICMYLSSDREYERIKGNGLPSSTLYRKPRDQEDFVSYEINPFRMEDLLHGQYEINQFRAQDLFREQYEKEQDMTQDLYMVKASDTASKTSQRFGTKLTVNSQGHYVLEMKGEGGKVEAFDPSELEIVLPYTVQVAAFAQGVRGFHFQSEAGKFNKDDILIDTGSGILYRVVGVDTKNRSPEKGKFTFIRLVGEKLTVENDN